VRDRYVFMISVLSLVAVAFFFDYMLR